MSLPPVDPPRGASHPDPELLALAALPAEPDDPAVTAHLRACVRCRTEVADLRRVLELAREGNGDPLPAPPPRVWHAIAAELGLPAERNGQVNAPLARRVGDTPGGTPNRDRTSNGEGAPHGNGTGPRSPAATPDPPPADLPPDVPPPDVPPPDVPRTPPGAGARSPRVRRRVLVPLVAAVLGLGVGLGVGHAVAPAPLPATAGPVVRLAPVSELDPAASGTAEMADDHGEREMVVRVQGVTDIPGDHLEAWLMDATGTRLVPLGALDGGGGDFHGTFALPEGLPLAEFGRVDVSAERWDGNPGHSTRSILRGDVV